MIADSPSHMTATDRAGKTSKTTAGLSLSDTVRLPPDSAVREGASSGGGGPTMADSDLNEEVESLQLEEEIVLASCSSRRLRKRPVLVSPLDESINAKRKRFVENKVEMSEKELTKLYLNENFRAPKQNPLETVYEEDDDEPAQPDPKTDKKTKRLITFPLFTTKAKKAQRKKMVKRLEVLSPTFLNNKKLKSKVSKAKFEALLRDAEDEDAYMQEEELVPEKVEPDDDK